MPDAPRKLDEAKLGAFRAKLVGNLNGAALALMTSIGHRTGLFDVMAGLQPSTSAEIAAAAGLSERYVREWLGAMTTGRYVEHDPGRGTYSLPPEHAALLTRTAQRNLAVHTRYIGRLGAVEDDIVECFRKGGGVPYERYGGIFDIIAETSGQRVLTPLREHILPLVPGLTERLQRGIAVLDLGCGRGRAINLLAEWFPASRFAGMDLSEVEITRARREAEEKGLANVEFVACDLSEFDRTAKRGAFDFITTFDAVHDQKDPKALLRGIRTSLADGGVYLAQDIRASGDHHGDLGHPGGPFGYTISCMHCMSVSLAQGGEGLGAMWGRKKALAYLDEAGFSDVQVHEIEGDVMQDYYVCRP